MMMLCFLPCRTVAASFLSVYSERSSCRLASSSTRPGRWITTTTTLSVLDEATASAAAKEAEEEVKRRRPRYQGKYPRNFTEKYKELGGDERTIQKVLQKGMTPAGTHVPIMLHECLEHMGIQNPMFNDNHPITTDHSTSGAVHREQEDNDQPALVVDCTLGYGGHSSHLIQALLLDKRTKNNGSTTTTPTTRHRLIAFDQDSIEIQKTDERLRAAYNLQQQDDQGSDKTNKNNNNNLLLFTTVHQNFATLGQYLQASGETGRVTSLLADLGLSSMQIDNNERGFTYKREGPLDMRMNTHTNDNNPATSANTASPPTSTETAYDLLCRLTPKELKSMLEENSDEIYAAEIANGILLKQKPQQQTDSPKKKKISNTKSNTDKSVIPKTTTELADRVRAIVEPLMLTNSSGSNNKGKGNNSNNNKAKLKAQLDSTVARVMQAIRIELNGEFRALDQLLTDLPTILAPNGRAVFLTFHSGEDRRVKKAFKSGYTSGMYSSWSRDVVRPTAQERRDNPRSSYCKLRWVIRSDKAV
jgi:16S rRNA (cytosine1402-N4)-methyltransferase